jgi:hypothetical protein
MSKKLLNEAEMRRFMGLAGIQSNLVSNRITEMYGPMGEDDEDPAKDPTADVVAPELDDAPGADVEEPEMMDQPMDMDPAGAEDSALESLSDEVKEELFSAVAQAAAEVLDLDVEMEMDGALPAADMGMDDDAEMEPPVGDDLESAGDGLESAAVDIEDEEESADGPPALTEEEIVNEVARRVAKRLVTASKANKTLREALGRK